MGIPFLSALDIFEQTAASVANPPSSHISIFSEGGKLKQKDSAGVVTDLTFTPVTSVFSRTGAVTAQSGDYNASQVTNTPTGSISATTVQAAIDELSSTLDLTQYKFSVTVGTVTGGSDYVCDGTNDQVEIQAAIDFVSANGGGIVYIKKGLYIIAGRITQKQNVVLMGDGMGITILRGGVTSDWMFYNTATISKFSVIDITLDCNNTTSGGLIALNKATQCNFNNVEFKNVASGGWMMALGMDTATGAINCFDNTFKGCVFDTHAGTLEMLLLMNARNTKVVQCKFKNKTTTGPILGIYQQLENTKIIDCTWEDNVGFAAYYSLSCNNTIFRDCYIKNTGGIQGGNLSDNGNFGYTQVKGIQFISNVFEGGTNGVNSTAIQIGAVDYPKVIGNTISGYTIGILLDDGNTAVPALSTNFRIAYNTVYNNTASNTAHIINPGILFSAIGGNCYGSIEHNEFFDTQGTATQRYPITFSGAFTWDNISIKENRLSAYGGGTSVALANSAVLGSSVEIHSNYNYTGSTPTQKKTFDMASDILTGTIAQLNAAITDSDLVDTTSTQTIGGTKTFSNQVLISSATALSIGTGGGSTPQLINMGGGGIYMGQVNGSFQLRSGFASKTFNLMSTGSITKFSVDLDTGNTTITGTVAASNLSGTNTGDNAVNSLYSGLATSKQDVDAGLTSIAALTGTGYIKATATDTYSLVSSIAQADVTNLTTDLAAKAPLASPSFTGAVTITTAAAANVVSLTVNQNDTTNNPKAIIVNNVGTGLNLDLIKNGSGTKNLVLGLRSNSTTTGTETVLHFSNTTVVTETESSGTGQISVIRTNAPNAGDTDMVFRTVTGGTLVERLRINASGLVASAVVRGTNIVGGFTSTATAAGTTTLTVTSNYIQEFTGTTTQTLVMPVVSTLTTGHGYRIINNSTGSITVNSSGGNLITTLTAGQNCDINCILITGTTAASWEVFTFGGGGGGSGANLSIANQTTNTLDILSDSGTDVTVPAATTSLAGLLTGADKTKLDGIATGATANSSDATLLNRANHTGTQAAATISDFASGARAQVEAELIAGSNITITPSGTGATRQLTIAATVSGGVTDGDKGDITVTSGVWNIDEPILKKSETSVNNSPLFTTIEKFNTLQTNFYGTGTVTLDTSVESEGTGCMKLSLVTGGNTGPRIALAGRTNFLKRAFTIKARASAWASISSAEILFATEAAFSNYYVWRWKGTNGKLVSPPDGEWIERVFNPGDCANGDTVGTPNWGGITHIIIRAQASAGTPDLYVDDFKSFPCAQKPMVCVTFDDGLASQYSNGLAKLDQYDIRATFYIIWDLLFDVSANATYMTQANLDTLSKMGHDIAGHGQGGAGNTGLGGLTQAQRIADFRGTKKTIGKYRGSNHYALPNGIYNDAIIADLLPYFNSIANIDWLSNTKEYSPNYIINRFSPDSATSTATIQAWIDNAIANNNMCIIAFHGIVASGATGAQVTQATYDTIIDYIGAKKLAGAIDTGTLTDYYARPLQDYKAISPLSLISTIF